MAQGNTLYLECRSGISGDMTVAALLDLGATEKHLRTVLAQLPLDGYEIQIQKVYRNGLEVCDFDVILSEAHSHLGTAEEHWEDSASHPLHVHRTWKDIRTMLEEAQLSPRVRELSIRMFETVAEAEGKVHGCMPEEVHFHEVGAVDSIVDIVSTAACMEELGIEKVVVSELWDGCGHIQCRHGILPVPVPAVLEIVSSHGLILRQTDQEGEMVTPTGAAIAALSEGKRPEKLTVKQVGMGAGKRKFKNANILRAMLLQE